MRKFLLFVLLIGCLIFSSSRILGQQNLDKSKEERMQLPSAHLIPKYENSETQLGKVITNQDRLSKRSDLVTQLHQARDSGNLELVKQIERKLVSTVPNAGESLGESVTRLSNSKGYPGEPKLETQSIISTEAFGTDIHVRSSNTDFRESYPSMATASDGTIYIVWENVNSSSMNDYLQLYKSTDDGQTWNAFGYIENATYNISQPSLAIGEGGQDLLVLAYIVNDLSVPYVEVATTPLNSFSTTMIIPTYFNFWESYQKPCVWTDSYDYSSWYIYLTTEAAYSASSNNYNVLYWRSIDYGASFSSPSAVFGDLDAYEWLDPDGTYGTIGNDIFIISYNATDNNLYMIKSLDFGSTWTDTILVNNINPIPSNPVDPDIEAAKNHDNIMLVCTKSYNGDDDIGQCYSTDAGGSWTTLYNLEGYTTVNEFAVDLQANEGGNNWHLAYTTQDWWVYYSTRPQDLSEYWQPVPDLVNDVDWASASYSKKSVTSNWNSDQAGISWADYRDPTAGDYDIYFDYNSAGEPDINVTPTSLTINQTKENVQNFDNQSDYSKPENLFSEVDRNEAVLTLEERYRYADFESLESSIQVKLVESNLNYLTEVNNLRIELFNGESIIVNKTRIVNRGHNNFSWFGKIAEDPNEKIILVRNGNSLSGSIYFERENYAVRTVGSGYYALIRQDLTNLPPEHPPEFESIIKSTNFEDFQLLDRNNEIEDTYDDGSTIDLLVAYTPSAASAAGNMATMIQLAVDETNQSYQNSNIFPRVNLVYSYQVSYSESGSFDTDLTRFRTDADGFMDEVHTYRDTYAADVCVLIINNTAYCGLASTIMADASSAFCTVHWDCATGYYSFGHEIGHLQGARHNPEADPTTTPFAYGHGYLYTTGGWRTIMAYNNSACPSGYCTRIQHWSNPDINYSGTPTGTSTTHDNARVLDETAYTVANFRVSSTSPNTFTIQNVGTSTLTINSISDDKSWLLHSGYPTSPFDLVPGASQNVSVSVDWNLISSSDFGTITVASNDPDEPSVDVTVTANPTLPAGPIALSNIIIDDDNLGNSLGNNDGIVNPGESVELYIELTNFGTITATGVNACLTEDSPFVNLIFNTCSDYNDITGGAFVLNLDDFDMDIGPNTPIGHRINFTLTITASNGGPWIEDFSLDVTADPPDISVSPSSLIFNVDVGGNDTQILTIENTAPQYSQALIWNIFDESTTVTLDNGETIPIKIKTETPEINYGKISNKIDKKSLNLTQYEESVGKKDFLQQISAIESIRDNVETKVYSEPRNYFPTLTGLESLLYDNGPIINSPGTGFGGADESVLQSALSMSIFGFGHQSFYNNRISDDFNVVDPSGWIIDSFIFYSYQSFSSNTSTITSYNYRIWDGPPGTPGSNIIYGDTLSNRLISSEWSGIYRVIEGDNGNVDRPIMENRVAAGLHLAQGTYWLDWQAGGTLSSGPWAPPITINGQSTTGNALQYLGSSFTWNSAMDVGTQGFPFRILGTAGSDAPWLTEDPLAGVTAPLGSTLIDITADAASLSPGTYHANLIITNNDPDENPIVIPVTLNVGSTTLDFAANLMIEDNCTNNQNLMFGTAPDATDGYDAAYDQFAPPPPPSGAFDARFRIGTNDLLKDFRQTISSASIEWLVIYQPATGCTPAVLTWNSSELPTEGSFRIVDAFTGGSLQNIDMRTQSSFSDASGLGQMKIIYSLQETFDHEISSGWNLVGLPLSVPDQYYLTLYPNAVPNTLFGFNSGYYSSDSLKNCIGYWLKFNAPEIVMITGTSLTVYSVDLKSGWNIISGLSCDVPVSSITDPSGVIVPGTLFGFNGAYFSSDTLKQGGGYWIKASGPGTISMSCTTELSKTPSLALGELADLTLFNSLEITDGKGMSQNLYFGGPLAKQTSPDAFQLPPIPPAGSFDARLTGNNWLSCNDEISIDLTAEEYPVILSLYLKNSSKYIVEFLTNGAVIDQQTVADGDDIVVYNKDINQIRILKFEPKQLTFELSQNYPNPFNPETIIKYSIPNSGNVELVIYDALGQAIIKLVDEFKEAGTHSSVWNGKNKDGKLVGSGIYFYSLKTDQSQTVKKLVFLK